MINNSPTSEGAPITEGLVIRGEGRRKICFIRDSDGNVLEFNQLLESKPPDD